MKLVILDRDGVINVDRPDFVRSVEQCQAIPGSIDAIARLSRAGYTVVVATNQSGLGRGLFDLEDLEAVHDTLNAWVEEAGGQLSGIFYCPHHPDDNCRCRKPLPGLLDAIEAEFNTSVSGVPLVGDSLRDLQAGVSRNCQLLLVETGNGLETKGKLARHPELAHTRSFPDLAAIADHLLADTATDLTGTAD